MKSLSFYEVLYQEEFQAIGRYLQNGQKDPTWSKEEFARIRRKSYGFLLRDEYLWRRPKVRDQLPLRVIDDDITKKKILYDCHDSAATGHRGVQETYDHICNLY
jgi:hypothetical protein